MAENKLVLVKEIVLDKIFNLRGQRIIIDVDLAHLYHVKTKALNQAVKRNLKRFPEDFMFQLSVEEKNELVTICDRLKGLKHSTSLPYAFTENGVSMLSTVLNSETAIQINIQIMRIFTEVRELMLTHKSLYHRLNKIEINQLEQKNDIKQINQIIEEMLKLPVVLKRKQKKIGFKK